MDWKLIGRLSLFGLVMAIATVYVVPPDVEPWIWLAIFLLCGWLIARFAPGKPFVHGLLLGIANSVWVTAAHVTLFDAYLAHHPREAAMMRSMPMPAPPRVMAAVIGPCVGIVSGVIMGLLALGFAWVLKRRRGAPATS